MIHVGDITKLHGEDIEPVDVITFGSPCQDLSTAGQRAGLYGEKSSLFLDTVLGSPPKTPSNRTYRGFCRTIRLRNIV